MQNEKTLQQMIREYELNMPPEIMDMINKFDWKRELRTIAMQNQLMADVGTDLEESVYMMLLGVAKVADVYERLIDVHELSEDRTKKVLEEVENKIFNVLHKKLAELEDEDIKKDAAVTPAISVIGSQKVEDQEDRDAILAEIEKDDVAEIVVKPILKPIIETKVEEVKANPVAMQPLTIGVIAPKSEENKINIIQTPGVAKPFSLNSDKAVITEDIKVVMPEITKGIQADPIASGLNKATVMSAPVINNNPAPTPKTSGAPDPYREPIE